MEWDALSGALGAIFWILFLVAKKRKQKAERPLRVRGPRKRARRAGKTVEFQRDYEPIEPK